MAEDSKDVETLEVKSFWRQGGGRKPSFNDEMQKELLAMIERLRGQGIGVASQDIQQWARTIATSNNIEKFSASNGWLQRFMTRHDLCLRRRTGDGYAVPYDYEEKVSEMIRQMEEIRLEFDVPDELILNADETGIFMDSVMRLDIPFKGERSVQIRSTGKEKNRITAMITATLSGDLLRPYLILKGSAISRLRKFRPNEKVLRRSVLGCSANAWMTKMLLESWITKVLVPYTQGRRAILLLDNFAPHRAPEIRELLEENNISAVWVPPN
ncbi:MAG: hypothetical protein AAGM67_11880, partial [Bacteroidota bacterium]